MKSIIFDTETTGFPQKSAKATIEMQPHIIEIGAMFIDDDGSVIRTISQLLYPGNKIWDKEGFIDYIPVGASKVNGITKGLLRGKPTFKEFLPMLSIFFEGADLLLAHNAKFDEKILEIQLERSKVIGFPWPKKIICTMLEYTHLNDGRWPKLEVLYEKIMQKKARQTHRALDDCMLLHELLVKDSFFEKIQEEEINKPPHPSIDSEAFDGRRKCKN